jgi:hypothetical protein
MAVWAALFVTMLGTGFQSKPPGIVAPRSRLARGDDGAPIALRQPRRSGLQHAAAQWGLEMLRRRGASAAARDVWGEDLGTGTINWTHYKGVVTGANYELKSLTYSSSRTHKNLTFFQFNTCPNYSPR